MDDVIAAPPEMASSFSGGLCWRDVEEAVERSLIQTKDYVDGQFTRIEDRLLELEADAERGEMMICSAMQQGFASLREEADSRWEARIRTLEREGERREAMIRNLEEEIRRSEALPVKVAVSLQEEDDKSMAAAGQKRRGWMKWIPAAILVADLYKGTLRIGDTSSGSGLTSVATANFLAGAAAGCTTLIHIYPLDIAHTRLAADIGKLDSRQFRGIHHFLQTIYRSDGIRGIYRGLPASLHGMVIHRESDAAKIEDFDEDRDLEKKDDVSAIEHEVETPRT